MSSMSDDQSQRSSKRPTEIDFLVTVGAENDITIPEPFADRFGIEPGRALIFVDSGSDDEFTVRVVRPANAGALTGVFGTTEENVAYVRGERASWEALAPKQDLIGEIQEILGLSQAETAAIFSVSQSTIALWRSSGIPKRRLASVERLHDLALLLRKELKPSRIPEIVRTKDGWLGDRTVIEVIQAEGVAPIYGYLARLFEYNP
jgi:bifunctional DNA-binding transcriptional regulator/antitoxin component of YhaV-PrlF toxin-antitoxin module